MKKLTALITAAAVLLSSGSLKFRADASETSAEDSEISGNLNYLLTENSYEKYISDYSVAEKRTESISIAIDKYISWGSSDCDISTAADSIGTLSWQGTGEVSWDFQVEYAGLYCFEMNYYSQSENNSSVLLGIDIDGEYPFDEAREIRFDRYWRNKHSIRLDEDYKNQVLPPLVKYNCNITSYARASEISDEPLWFYLSSGTHKLSLHGVSTDFYISSLKFCGKEELKSYSEIKPSENKLNATPALIDNAPILVEAEMPKYTNSAAIRPTSESSDYAVSPSHPVNIRYNTIGADSWNTAGQMIFYEVTVASDGYYALNMKCRLNTGSGLPSNRRIYVNGKVVCEELNNIEIPYSDDWQTISPTDANGEQIFIELKAGKNLIAFEAINGEASRALRNVNAVVSALAVSVESDEIYSKFGFYAQEILTAKNELENASKCKINSSELDVLINLLKKYEDKQPENLSDLKKCLNSACKWIEQNENRSVEMDYFELRTVHEQFRDISRDFFKQLVFGFRRFVGSFFADYNTLISDKDKKSELSVWASGNNAPLSENISTEFGDDITVVKGSGSLLETVLSGNVPDIALFVDEEEVYELAKRGLIVNLATLSEYGAVESSSPAGVSKLYEYNGGTYAVPLTNSYPMLFFREDILNELGLSVPESWDDLEKILPVLSENGMTAGVGSPSDFSAGNAFMLMMSQSEKGFNGSELDLCGEYAQSVFKRYTEFYTKYNCPQEYDAFRLFKAGKMPIVIADYSQFYSQLSSAEEIRGLWSIAHIPGTRTTNDDGKTTLNFNTNTSSLGAVIFTDCKDTAKAWKYLSWFSQPETQTKFGVLKEACTGEIYAPSSLAAVSNLRPSKYEFYRLRIQASRICEISNCEIISSLERGIYSAFIDTISGKSDPCDAIAKYGALITAEIARNKK